MNRRQRRELERKGQIPKAEPVYNMKPKAMVDAVLNGSGKDIMMEYERMARERGIFDILHGSV